ncbi:uncharacterized protein Taf12L [Drosophila kikkawai]|uniref:Transcription initiation factor TFIID subunit 12 n=1 Tax=Drosophila kikkawai TaxID=30033 RepID=A0A6P4I963_DROKI|nr:uncharacterized protein LOC108076883 [Drosophila kikkawai]
MDLSSDDSDSSFGNGSPLTNRSSSSSSDTSSVSSVKSNSSSSEEERNLLDSNYDIITELNLKQFVFRVDRYAVLDDQAVDMVAKIADVFVNDVARRVVKLAQYRKERMSLLDLKFTLKREYNMEFPHDIVEEK